MNQKKVVYHLTIMFILLQSFPVLSQWNYYVNDHLGNTRVVLDEDGDVKEYYDYYHFGMTMRDNVSGSEKARYKFTGKEEDEELGLKWHYFGARYYDAEIGRWLGVDPLAEKYPSLSSYVYVANNPFKFLDKDGKDIKVAPNLKNTSFDPASNFLRFLILGQEAWNAVNENHNILVYFTNLRDMNEMYDKNAWTYNTASRNSKYIYNINIYKPKETITVDNPNNQLIYIVAIDNEELRKKGIKKYAETIYHELLAHVLDSDFTKKPSSSLYGKYRHSITEQHEIYYRNLKEPFLRQAREEFKAWLESLNKK